MDIDPQAREIMAMSSVLMDLLDKMGMFDPPLPACRCGCPHMDHTPIRRGDGPWMLVCRGCRCDEYDDEAQ
jgi:hypothetical protein